MSEESYLQKLHSLADSRRMEQYISLDELVKDTGTLLSLDEEQTAHFFLNILLFCYPNDIAPQLKLREQRHRYDP
jgi:hypothetical protein